MTTDAFHPDHLQPGSMVGPWRILESLGSGNFGHAFKAERDGDFFTLKMAVRPAPGLGGETQELLQEARQVDGRMRHEAATLMANASHPGIPHLRAVDRWPHVSKGYLYIVTDFVPGEPFHVWRKRTHPSAAQLVDIFIEVVRVVAQLHRHGVLIRDLKSEHIIIHPTDHKPVLVDLGSAWLPGGSLLTEGLAPGTPHALPPECVAFVREGRWQQGARFKASETGDLYQLGVFMYEALTLCWPFDPGMPTEELLVAIETVLPRAPHRLNPEAPESLSLIVMKLLEKRPEDRYLDASALSQALWEAAKERSKKSWKVPLELPPEGPAPMTQDEVEERRLQKQEAERRAREVPPSKAEALSREQALEQLSYLTREIEAQVISAEEKEARGKKRKRRAVLVAGACLLGLTLFATGWWWFTPHPSAVLIEKGSAFVSTLHNSRPGRAVLVWLCATLSFGCPAAPVRPLPGDCPQEVVQGMRELGLLQKVYAVVVDINQPGNNLQEGVYHAGKIVSRVVRFGWTGPLPEGTLLYGQLWTEGLTKEWKEAVLGRYTEALLPDGRRIPVCMILGDATGLTIKKKGSKPGEARLQRRMEALPVEMWP
ncbi:serine/threonine protein kinase [Stigmatella aurantiaca]|uniref:non-specific serine/threonine protein kinase n=1 Tax=Stigmatella aurantiaca (strain DW4/3-1) TaxID=378806 RepID=Q09A09_STIAD|nr:serine/threonine-protein kinase [Stigmatella aurantiaca]ADO68932.1 Serine/threonine-protein kinase [Stigmatella aurantiaca DW4/3-1]EAU68567.1 putative serine/threonine protein kinase [Stigmatella aurantiaca DW4/3-1]